MSLFVIRKSKTTNVSSKQNNQTREFMIVLEPIIYFNSNPTTTGGNILFYTYTKVTKDLLHNRQRKRNATCIIKHNSYTENNNMKHLHKMLSWKEAYDFTN